MNTLFKSRCLMLVCIIVLTLLHLCSFIITGPSSGGILFGISIVLFFASILVPKYNIALNFIMLNFLCAFSESLITRVVLIVLILNVVYRYFRFNYIDNYNGLSVSLGMFLVGMFFSLNNIPIIFSDLTLGIINIFISIGLCIAYTELWKEIISNDPPKDFEEYY